MNIYLFTCIPIYIYIYIYTVEIFYTIYNGRTISELMGTAILIINEGQFQVFPRFSSSKLLLKAGKSCFVALNYYENASIVRPW
jgi:hypothetical protein